MNETEKLRHCIGCEDNFYNGNNPMGVHAKGLHYYKALPSFVKPEDVNRRA